MDFAESQKYFRVDFPMLSNMHSAIYFPLMKYGKYWCRYNVITKPIGQMKQTFCYDVTYFLHF
jgi:hypothetical protein